MTFNGIPRTDSLWQLPKTRSICTRSLLLRRKTTSMRLKEFKALTKPRFSKVNIQGGDHPAKIAYSTKGFFVVSYAESKALEAYATFKKVCRSCAEIHCARKTRMENTTSYFVPFLDRTMETSLPSKSPLMARIL